MPRHGWMAAAGAAGRNGCPGWAVGGTRAVPLTGRASPSACLPPTPPPPLSPNAPHAPRRRPSLPQVVAAPAAALAQPSGRCVREPVCRDRGCMREWDCGYRSGSGRVGAGMAEQGDWASGALWRKSLHIMGQFDMERRVMGSELFHTFQSSRTPEHPNTELPRPHPWHNLFPLKPERVPSPVAASGRGAPRTSTLWRRPPPPAAPPPADRPLPYRRHRRWPTRSVVRGGWPPPAPSRHGADKSELGGRGGPRCRVWTLGAAGGGPRGGARRPSLLHYLGGCEGTCRGKPRAVPWAFGWPPEGRRASLLSRQPYTQRCRRWPW